MSPPLSRLGLETVSMTLDILLVVRGGANINVEFENEVKFQISLPDTMHRSEKF